MDEQKPLFVEPLKYYSTVFKIYIWAGRIYKIIIRLLFFILVVWVFLILTNSSLLNSDGTYSLNYSSGDASLSLNGLFFVCLVILFGKFMIMLTIMQTAMNTFSEKNNFAVLKQISYPPTPDSALSKMNVPSFVGKPLRVSLYPVLGTYQKYRFGFFTRQYKEGGVVRWRERKMDTILWIEVAKPLPHIVVDSRLNERARRSNLSKKYNTDYMLRFEGVTGDRYTVYTAPGNHIAALQLFTPDVLEVFYERLPLVDIEVKGKTIWFVWRYGVLNPKLAKDMFEGVAEFMNEFSKQTNTATFTEKEILAEID